MNNDYNPDVLSCIANLSSDEVFTPPQLVNQILDMIPKEIWTNKNARFLDPGCKSGVFLREIAKRLDKGLEKQISDRQNRLNHIFKNQLFGLAITELTSLLSRRSVYCSKTANGKYSVCEAFDEPHGNIRFKRVDHSWEGGRCVFCGANEANYERGEKLGGYGGRSSVYKVPISYFFWLAIWRPRATDRLIAACESPSFLLSHA
jgi:site-specific DNA-methyltransferase (adenine-specific)